MKQFLAYTFSDFKFLGSPLLSNDEKTLYYILSEVDIKSNQYKNYIYMLNLSTKESRKLTSGGKEINFIELTSSHLLFSRFEKKDGNIQTDFYKLPTDGGESTKWFSIPMNVSKFIQIKDDEFLIIADFKNRENKAQYKEKDFYNDKDDYKIITEIPFRQNGKGYTDKQRQRLYRYKVNEKLKPLTPPLMNVSNLKLSKDKNLALFIGNKFENKMDLQDEIYILDLKKDRIKRILNKKYMLAYSDFLDDKNILFLGALGDIHGINENPKLYKLPLESDKEIKISKKDFDFCSWSGINTDLRLLSGENKKIINKKYYFTANTVDTSQLKVIDIKGNLKNLTPEDISLDSFQISKDEKKIFFIGFQKNLPQEIYLYKDEKLTKLTNHNDIISEYKVNSPEKFSFKNGKTSLYGYVIKPSNYKKNVKFPAILSIHGGPKTTFGKIINHEMQYLSSQGYFIIYTNPRGSDGFGDEFSDIRGKYGSIDYDDLMKFVDECLKKYPEIDEKKLGVMGGSYGGFMTNWIIGHTNRFKAACSQRSISNWIHKFCTTDIGYYFTYDQTKGADPWNDPEKLWETSPLKYADKAETPTLFIHSDEDYRCTLPEAISMFTALKYNNVDSKLVIFKGENHELSRSGKPQHRIKRLKEICEWFDKYLK